MFSPIVELTTLTRQSGSIDLDLYLAIIWTAKFSSRCTINTSIINHRLSSPLNLQWTINSIKASHLKSSMSFKFPHVVINNEALKMFKWKGGVLTGTANIPWHSFVKSNPNFRDVNTLQNYVPNSPMSPHFPQNADFQMAKDESKNQFIAPPNRSRNQSLPPADINGQIQVIIWSCAQ